jgi:glutamate-1-semialdehyde aminotransferase
MNWMVRWGPFPIFVTKAQEVTVHDVDNKKYLDLCLGDTGKNHFII